jgi:tripartite-type tricarboxylate transporter receptor subunit TctC
MKNTLTRRAAAGVVLLLATGAFAAPPAGWPNQPIKLITPYAAGGGSDFFARAIAPKMGEALGQTVVVENRPGGNGVIAAVSVAKTLPADGYSILLGDRGMYALNPSLYDNLAYDPLNDLVPVTLIAKYDFVLVVNPQVLPVKTVAEVIAAAKASPNGLNYASPGNQSTHRMAMELFGRDAAINLVPIPYKGGAPALQDVLAGQVGMMFLDRASAMQQIEAGKLRLIAAAGKKRIAAYPNTPTIAESGLKDFSAEAWLGLTMRKGTNDEIVRAVRDAFVKTIADPELKQKLAAIGIETYSSTPEEFARFMQAETAQWGKIIRERGIKPN